MSKKCQRVVSKYVNHGSKFQIKGQDYSHQYAHLYAERLNKLTPRIKLSVRKKWGNLLPLKKLYEIQVNEECIVIGTLYKHMELKPTILKQIAAEEELLPPLVRQRYTDIADKLFLEDEMQRIQLEGTIDVAELVTGVIIGVRGFENDDGKFTVMDYCFHGLLDQPPLPDICEDKYVMLVSGLCIGSDQSANSVFNVELLIDSVCGEAGSDVFQRDVTANICRVIIAGNSVSRHTQNREIGTKAKYLTRHVKASSVDAVREVDGLLERLVSSVPVDVMPGQYDPTNCMLPQQPLHRAMLPRSAAYTTLNTTTNPYEADIDGIRFLGTSGQPLDDIFRYSVQSEPINMLKFLLECAHLAPTAPDTLSCYPYYDTDPFIISSCPHVFFAGNQEEFSSKKIADGGGGGGQQVSLVCVPKFCDTNTVVLVNLRTLECQPVHFDSSLSPQQNAPHT